MGKHFGRRNKPRLSSIDDNVLHGCLKLSNRKMRLHGVKSCVCSQKISFPLDWTLAPNGKLQGLIAAPELVVCTEICSNLRPVQAGLGRVNCTLPPPHETVLWNFRVTNFPFTGCNSCLHPVNELYILSLKTYDVAIAHKLFTYLRLNSVTLTWQAVLTLLLLILLHRVGEKLRVAR